MKIILKESNLQDDATQRHVYKLTKDPEHEIIEVYVNDELFPFDNITGL